MTKEECKKVLYGFANSINALRCAKVGDKGFYMEMSKEFAFKLEDAIHSACNFIDQAIKECDTDDKDNSCGT